jgi:hypothetical protein
MTSQRSVFDLLRDLTRGEYEKLLEYATGHCCYAQVTVRDDLGLNETGLLAVRQLSAHLRSERRSSSWPGTTLLSGEATLYRYALNLGSCRILKAVAPSLYSWQQPSLPEDLCLLRDDGEPWLVSIAHEMDGYFVLTQSEHEGLVGALPELSEDVRRAKV